MSDFNNDLEQYKEQTRRDGENLVRNVFPKRVFEMQELLNSVLFNMDRSSVFQVVNLPVPLATEQNGFDKSNTKPFLGTPVYTFPSGKISHNIHIKKMIETAKPYLTQLMVEAQVVRMWIQFNVPRIEDGNNFGVGIQEDVLAEVSGIERDALTFLDQFTRYYASRGKLVAKAAKYPHIDDYRECVRDMDEKQAISMRYVIMEIRNHYSVLHDLIEKNLDRIKVPRSNNTMSMY
nr:Proteasome activator pa28 REG alpha beta subunit [Hymenolepis microstoma]